MAYLSSAALPTLYGKLYITKRSTFRTSLAVFLLHLRLVRLSRFANLNTFKIPPLTFGHTTPAIAYTSGMYSLPSAATRGARSAVAGSLRFPRFDRSSRPDEQRIARDGAIGQPLSAGVPIGTQWQGPHAVEGTARERTR